MERDELILKVKQLIKLHGEEAAAAIADIITGPEVKPYRVITALMVIETVCKYFGVTKTQLVQIRREQKISYRRQICAYLIRRRTTTSMKEVARLFGQDHTTPLQSYYRIECLIKTDELVRKEVEYINSLL